MKVYVDIDGVLITTKQKMPIGIKAFIEFLTSNYDCYWLTTHCRGGENKAIQYLSNFFEEPELYKLRKLKPTDWTDLKTEAIDFESDFIWLDDYPFESEKMILAQKNKVNSLIKVNLCRQEELSQVINKIRKLVG